MMKKFTLKNPSNEIQVSQLAIGHLNMHLPHRTEIAYGFMEEYLEKGGNTFDNSRNTGEGHSEKYLGKFIQKTGKRDQMVIATKCAHHDRKYYAPRLNAASIFSDVDTSLTLLATDYVDILYLHRDDIARPVEEVMVALDKVVKSGKARILGASNWSATRLQEANDFANSYGLTPFSVSQINYSLGLTTSVIHGDVTQIVMDPAEKSWYEGSKMLLMPYSPNARGFFSQILSQGEAKDKPKELYNWCPENHKRAQRVKALAEKTGQPVGVIVLAYLLSQEIDICPVIAFSKQEQFDEALQALNCQLSPEDLAYLEGYALLKE